MVKMAINCRVYGPIWGETFAKKGLALENLFA
jgi:hypothetical protein